MTAGDISVSSTHRHSHPHNISHAHNSARHLSGSSTQTTAMAHHHHHHQHHQHHQRSSAQSHEYLEASQSPVPSLTNATLRSSSVSSSVNSLSPDAHQATTPRDLLPQFQSVSNACHASIDSVADSVGADGTEFKKRRRDEEEEEKEEVVVRSGGDSRSAPLPLPQQQQQQPESKKRRTTRRLVTGERRPLTGSTDFVKLFGLSGLYDEFVRPYIVDGQVRRTLPDLAASDYLRGVNGAVAHGTASVDLVGLVKAPPKSQFSKLDPLPMTSIRAAFAIGNDEKTKKPVVKHQGTSEQSKSQQSRQSNSGDHRHRSQQSSTSASQPKAARY